MRGEEVGHSRHRHVVTAADDEEVFRLGHALLLLPFVLIQCQVGVCPPRVFAREAHMLVLPEEVRLLIGIIRGINEPVAQSDILQVLDIVLQYAAERYAVHLQALTERSDIGQDESAGEDGTRIGLFFRCGSGLAFGALRLLGALGLLLLTLRLRRSARCRGFCLTHHFRTAFRTKQRVIIQPGSTFRTIHNSLILC